MTYAHIEMAAGAHDRAGVHRNDEAFLSERWAEPGTRVLVVANGRLHAVDGQLEWVGADQAPDGLKVLLGEKDGRWHFAVLVHDRLGPDDEWVGLREFLRGFAEGDSTEAPLAFHAVGLAEWHRTTRFCPRDGAPLEPRAAGHELACTQCGRPQFPRTDPAVIMIVSDGEPGSPEERCLLGRPASWPTGRYSTLAGFVEPGESLEDAVRREVAEETSVQVGEVRYFGNQPWPFPASLMLGFSARAVGTDVEVDGQEIEDARWFTREQMRAEAQAGTLVLPGGISISRSLVENWYGGPLPESHW